ncbi:MAG TPA: DNA polymerase III subunit alpha, partial [Luteibaculaceae bacterium]|nr:DNA polymerase III subunit alpha [Luteibaculaceae bacterium]
IGCFYVESPAMRMLLTKLKAHDYLRLVAASSIIRPGVAKSGMMREYILRFQDVNRRQQARDRLPELYDILEETFGVMVYQEDVLKVAHFFGGLTLAEADVLRRGMNWKYMQRTEFTSVKAKFLSNCYQKGYSEQVVSEIWNQIESFANFAFAKGHSASYAVESYQALFLKAYYPLEYMVATTNNGGGFYREELYLHEAVMCGAELKPPCVNKSDGNNSIRGTTIHIGLSNIAGIESDSVQSILTERHHRGLFKGLRDFVSRVPLSLEQLILLIRVGAFQFTGLSVKQLLWDAHFIAHKTKPTKGTLRMFEVSAKTYTLPELPDHPLEIAYHELELLGFPLISPFKLLKNQVTNPMLAGHLPFKINQQVDIVAYLVNRKPSKTANGQVMYFGTWLDQAGVWVDTVHFPHNARLYPFTGPGCYELRGWVREEFGFICIEVQYMKRLETKNLDDLHLEEHLELSLYQGG